MTCCLPSVSVPVSSECRYRLDYRKSRRDSDFLIFAWVAAKAQKRSFVVSTPFIGPSIPSTAVPLASS